MCGIVGIFGKENSKELVEKGLKLISYRGRDGSDIVSGDNFSIGHCLHAVVSDIKQPFKGKGIFVVNCEIYNWEELCEKYKLDSRNDAELFFNLLEKFGVEKTLEIVDGDYAGAYLINNKLYLFRDRIGVKPVWYAFDGGFGFASERKVLKNLGFENVFELNPRELLIYDVKNNSFEIKNLGFFDLVKQEDEYEALKKKLSGYLVNSIAKRVPKVKLGVLFSGGVDSSFIALVLKKLGVDFRCYACSAKGLGDSKDLEYAKKVAEYLDLDLEIVEIDLDEVEKDLPLVCKLIESNNVTKVSVALPFYFASKKAKEEGVKVLFSGVGSEDLFAGYQRYLKSDDVNKECYHGLLNIYEKDLYRDDVVTMYNSIELRVPYLDKELVAFGLSVDGKYKIKENFSKFILRDIAKDFGLDEFAFRKRTAAQYGSNFLKAVDKLAKKNDFKIKSKYLASFYDEGNVKLAALFSSGKDSCYAIHIMRNQNYNVKCLVTIRSENKDSFMYHTPNVDLAKLQSEAIEIPLIIQDSSGEKEKELEDLEKALVKAKDEYKIEGVVCGALFSTYQRDRVHKIATKLGLKFFAPLWHKNQELLLGELLSHNFRVIISSVASDGLDESWLGREIGSEEIEKLVKLNKKVGINVAGEGGEFESLVLDCPLFKKKLVVEDFEKIMDSSCSGLFKIKKVKLVHKR